MEIIQSLNEVVKDVDNLEEVVETDIDFYGIQDLDEFNVKAEEYCNYSNSKLAGYLIKDYSKEENPESELLKHYSTLEELKYFADLIGADVSRVTTIRKKVWVEAIIKHQSLWGRTKLVKGLNKVPTTLSVIYKYKEINIPTYLSFRVRASDSKYSFMPVFDRIKPFYKTAPNTVEEVTYLVLLDPVEYLEDIYLEHKGYTLNLRVKNEYYNSKLDRVEQLYSIWSVAKSIFISFQFKDLSNRYVFTEYVARLEEDNLVKESIINNYELLTSDTLLPYSLTIDLNNVKIVNKISSLTRSSILQIGNYTLSLNQTREHKNVEWDDYLEIELSKTKLMSKRDNDFVKLRQALESIAEDPNGYYKTIELRHAQQKK